MRQLTGDSGVLMHIILTMVTWVGVRWMRLARCSRSGAERYFCCLNLLSSSYTCTAILKSKQRKIPLPSPDCSYIDMMVDTVTDVWSDLEVTWCDMV